VSGDLTTPSHRIN